MRSRITVAVSTAPKTPPAKAATPPAKAKKPAEKATQVSGTSIDNEEKA